MHAKSRQLNFKKYLLMVYAKISPLLGLYVVRSSTLSLVKHPTKGLSGTANERGRWLKNRHI